MEKGKVPVILVMKKPESASEDWPYTIFHEMLHASDPDYALMVTQDLHNRGSFPDAVYGCTYAVRRRVDEGWTRLQTFVYDSWSLAEQGIPMVETRCDNCKRPWDQRQMNKFGWLCANDGPFMTDEMRPRLPQLEQTYCLINGVRDKCTSGICAEYTAAFGRAGSAPTLKETFALSEKVNDFLFVAEAFEQRMQGATPAQTAATINGRQSALMEALKTAGVLRRCSTDANAYD